MRTIVPVPKAAMNEYDFEPRDEHQIRSAGKLARV
jgi:hypothetical protein